MKESGQNRRWLWKTEKNRLECSSFRRFQRSLAQPLVRILLLSLSLCMLVSGTTCSLLLFASLEKTEQAVWLNGWLTHGLQAFLVGGLLLLNLFVFVLKPGKRATFLARQQQKPEEVQRTAL